MRRLLHSNGNKCSTTDTKSHISCRPRFVRKCPVSVPRPWEIVPCACLPNKKSRGFICIIYLKTFVVIINIAVAVVACNHDEFDMSYIPILLSYCDKHVVVCVNQEPVRAGPIGRALCQFFMELLMSTDISTQADWLSKTDNKLADENIEFDFTCLVHDYPQLQEC